jgi:glycosyltransferase involved in cell wall biosynthesis
MAGALQLLYMARVAVLHNTLDFHGGADAVSLAVCEALQADHDVVLYTISETLPSDLGPQFGIEVDVPVRMPPAGTSVARALGTATPRVGPQLALRSVLVHQYFCRHVKKHDVAVSTANEFALPLPSVQYVHYPQFNLAAIASADHGLLNSLWSRLAGPQPGDVTPDATLVANSAWTADVVATIYDRRPTVIHPPVDPIPDRLPWADRENGVVTVGRLAPDKRVLEAIYVVDQVRDRGHDVHLHVVGTAARTYREYAARIEQAASARAFVHLERDVPRDRLETLLRTHKYGLNMKRNEHFGMAVAEFVAAGMVPFAPNSGGQRDVLEGQSDRLFGSVDEAVNLLTTAITTDIRPTLPPDRFAREHFNDGIRHLVSSAVNGDSDR